MKKVIIISVLTMLMVVYMVFSSCGGGNSKSTEEKPQPQPVKDTIIHSNQIRIIKEESKNAYEKVIFIKNISGKVLNGDLTIKINNSDGTSYPHVFSFKDFYPEEVDDRIFGGYPDIIQSYQIIDISNNTKSVSDQGKTENSNNINDKVKLIRTEIGHSTERHYLNIYLKNISNENLAGKDVILMVTWDNGTVTREVIGIPPYFGPGDTQTVTILSKQYNNSSDPIIRGMGSDFPLSATLLQSSNNDLSDVNNSEQSISQISNDQNTNSEVASNKYAWIIGEWECVECDLEGETITFDQNGNFNGGGECGSNGKYTIDNNMIYLKGITTCEQDGSKENYNDTIAIQGNGLKGYRKL